MKKLTKEQNTQRDELLARLEIADKAMQDAIIEANALIETKVAEAINAYNDVVGDMETFRDDVIGEMEAYFDDRSEKWQEGDAGQEYASWKSDWEGLDTELVEPVEAIEAPSPSHREDLENMASEVPS